MSVRYICPDCTTLLTQTKLVRGSSFVCQSCGGVLVNASVLRDQGDGNNFASLWSSARTESFASNRLCPSCRNQLRTFATEESRGSVALDLCAGCQAFWFDAGELQKVGVRLEGRKLHVAASLAEIELEGQQDQAALGKATSNAWTLVHYLRREFLHALLGRWLP